MSTQQPPADNGGWSLYIVIGKVNVARGKGGKKRFLGKGGDVFMMANIEAYPWAIILSEVETISVPFDSAA